MYAFMASLSIDSKYRVAPLSQSAPIPPMCPADLGKTSVNKNIHSLISNKASFLEEKLTADVMQYKDVSHRETLQKAEAAVKKILKRDIPGIKIWMTGSVPAGADALGSDLDMSIKVEGLKGTNLQKLHECRKMLLDGPIYEEDLKPRVLKAKVSVLKLFHEATQTEIDVTIDNDAAKRNTQLLVWYGQIDARFQVLCRAVKDWAKSVGVQGAKEGRLNSFSLCLMVTHYLQVCGILPNLQELFPELNGDFEVENDDYQKRNLKTELEQRGHRFGDNESSVGVLFAGFLKYYAEFNFDKNWISVRHGRLMKKKWDEIGEPMNGMPQSSERIVVADPFLDPAWNCGGSVWASEVCERIQLEFQLSLDRLTKGCTLFGCHLKSVTRRKLEAVGKERDSQFELWKEEWLAGRKKKEIESGKVKSDEWMTPPETWATEWEEIPHQGYRDPKQYWDIQEKQKIMPPWPSPLRCRGY